MYPDQSLINQQGAGLPVAIFVVTVLALVVFSMAQIQQGSGEAVSLQIQYQGRACPADWTLNFTEDALSSCSARIRCAAEDASAVPGSGGDTLYTINSRGRCGGGVDAAERVVEVRVR